MKIEEACSILGVNKEDAVEDIKVKYKNLAKTKHPDIDKSPDATNNFQRINEAYQVVKDFKSGKLNEQSPFIQGTDFGDIFSGFGFGNPFAQQQQRKKYPQSPSIDIVIDFKDSVIGCTRQIKYNRTMKCNPCNGVGYSTGRNNCQKCDGFGRISYQKGNMHISSMCSSCLGRNTIKTNCASCSGTGELNSEISLSINIPIGVKNGDILKIRGAGHFVQATPFGDEHTDASLKITVNPLENMIIVNNDVISTLDISLLEALTGTEKVVNTVYENNMTIKVPIASKNKDEININNHGLKNTNGVHKFIININYPENLQPLIETLKEK